MADDQVDIKIVTTADTSGAVAAEKSLDTVTKATDKSFASTKQLKDAVKQLGNEFPILGQLGRLALNPILLSVAGITAAFRIWKTRVDELAISLGGIEMANVKEDDITRINRVASAWGEYAKNIAAAATSQKQIKTDLEATVSTIKANDKLMAAMGINTGTKSTEAEAAAKSAAADKLEADARARIARAGTPGSKAGEASLEASLKAAADKAIKDMADAQARKDEITELSGMSAADPRRVYYDAKFRARYGYGASYESAGAMEQGNIESQRAIVNRYSDFQSSSQSRDVRRSELSSGTAQLDEVAALRREVLELRRQVGTGSMGAAFGQAGKVGSATNIVGVMTETAQTMILLSKALSDIQRANAELRSQMKSGDRLPK
jgi:hypothetical protein